VGGQKKVFKKNENDSHDYDTKTKTRKKTVLPGNVLRSGGRASISRRQKTNSVELDWGRSGKGIRDCAFFRLR